jgi:Xaa-Pro aminopeptidase
MKEITQLYRPGHCINEINQAAKRLMGEYGKYLIHGVSHHIGLDVHDSVDKFKPFEPGMILTCEPGMYIREEGIGIRIENDLLITKNEPVNLFEGLPIEVAEIEAAMQR